MQTNRFDEENELRLKHSESEAYMEGTGQMPVGKQINRSADQEQDQNGDSWAQMIW